MDFDLYPINVLNDGGRWGVESTLAAPGSQIL
jgi:hypothetical protein